MIWKSFGLTALQLSHKLGVKAQLKNGFGFRLTGQFAVHDFVRPVAQAARSLDSEQHVGAASPIAAGKAGLENGLSTLLHGCKCC